ncbi:MAG TPA: sulfatase-like hydrolase/transferase, partial [Thermoguttaceae bacterium]|nr:sulfatase-like hydrolase/transferase [Thermoguttaceae bacterium]
MPRSAICLVVDRWHSGYVGAYGNTWLPTPEVDRLAARGFVFDQAIIDSPELERLYRAWWQGWPAIRRREAPEDWPSLARRLGESGVHTALLTDEPLLARSSLAEDFAEVVLWESALEAQVAATIDQTHAARCFAQMVDWLEKAPRPFWLWCHWTGFGGPWDAPLELRESFREEDDPPAYPGCQPPEKHWVSPPDPDELLAYSFAYAGQAMVLDACLGGLAIFLADSGLEKELLWVLLGARGYPLGEHGRLGPCDEALYSELVQTPWIMVYPDGLGATARSQALVEPADLWATLLGWWQLPIDPPPPTAYDLTPVVREEVLAVRDRICLVHPAG